MYRVVSLVACMVLLCMLAPCDTFSKFYKYLDKDGEIHFVDNMSKIPHAYRRNIDSYSEKYDHLSEEERKEAILEDQKEARRIEQQRKERERELAEKEREESLKTKVVIRNNQVLVPVKLKYWRVEHEAVLLLDTGASITVLHSDLAERLCITDSVKSYAQVAGGRIITIGIAELKYIKLGPYTMKDASVSIIEHKGPAVEHQGLLGMDFLQGLDFDIDYNNQLIRWKQ